MDAKLKTAETDAYLDDSVLDASDVEEGEYDEGELDEEVEFDPFEGMSDEELDALADSPLDMAESLGLVAGDTPEGFRSGFVALVGRPNAGKSTLLNACMGTKVAITSPVAQTTRRRMRAVVNRPDFQLVFVDTPGIHKPKDGLGSELNRSALAELGAKCTTSAARLTLSIVAAATKSLRSVVSKRSMSNLRVVFRRGRRDFVISEF